MSGVRNGVQALIKEEQSRALYVHCLAHSLNLCVQDVTKKCVLIRNVMDFIHNLIKFSPKRLYVFDSLRKDAAISGGEQMPSLRNLCPTRWTVRHSAINSILLNYEVLLRTLETVEVGHDEYAAKAHGLHMRMESFDTYFGLKLAYTVYSAAEQFFVNLQVKNITVQEAIRGAKLLVSHLKSLRTEAHFDTFYEQILVQSATLTEEPQLPRYRKLPEEGDHPHRYVSPKDKYRHDYFEILELAAGEIERRFEQPDIAKIKEIESLLIDAANGKKVEIIPDSLLKYFEDDVNAERLKIQLPIVADMIKTSLKDTMAIKVVTNVRTIADTMQESEIYKGMLTEIDKVLKIYFTFPVTSATAERSFSAIRRIKTFLRTSMTHCWLNNLFLLYIHMAKTDSLDLKAVARDFVNVNSRRLHYFGKI